MADIDHGSADTGAGWMAVLAVIVVVVVQGM